MTYETGKKKIADYLCNAGFLREKAMVSLVGQIMSLDDVLPNIQIVDAGNSSVGDMLCAPHVRMSVSGNDPDVLCRLIDDGRLPEPHKIKRYGSAVKNPPDLEFIYEPKREVNCGLGERLTKPKWVVELYYLGGAEVSKK